MRIPAYLEIAQWALLLALGCLVVVLYRQLGRLMGQPARHAELGPAVGSTAAAFRYASVPGGTTGHLRPGDGRPTLLAFVDPTCPACEQLVTTLSHEDAVGALAGLRVLLLVSDPPAYIGISPAFQATSLDIGRPVSTAEIASYRAVGTPLLVAIDDQGIVRLAGTASAPAEVRAHVAAARGGSLVVATVPGTARGEGPAALPERESDREVSI